ncbi:SusD/RagB family nutrient-binding outer membrane lipoprotein [Bacteroides thetaiotaomicron]|nr:SusD/RagB family nutrient-binding outer membrane lipoprotein [Bacteroides thetaiotaomicron]
MAKDWLINGHRFFVWQLHLKISDCYGPIPYSQITGTAFTVEYDNMEDLYKHMFDDLDEAISAFKVAVLGNEDMSSFIRIRSCI